MDGLPLILLVLGALAVTAVSRRLRLAAPLALVVAGLAISAIPGVPDYQLDPDLVLYGILPPLLYSAALASSAVQIRANIRPIALLAVGLVLFTIACVGLVAWWLVPGLPLPAALALAAVVAPPDAVAAVSIGRRLGLPRRVMTVLVGESLFNDATALTVLRVAVAATAGAGLSLWSGLGEFLLVGVGGVVLGAVAGRVVHQVRLRLGDPRLESALGLVVPFAAYALAEQVHVSGVLAVVVTGLYLGHHAPQAGYATRLQDQAVWQAADTVLEAFVFALIGLQLPAVVRGVGDVGPLLSTAAVVLTVAALARVVWVFPATYLPRALFTRVNARDPQLRCALPGPGRDHLCGVLRHRRDPAAARSHAVLGDPPPRGHGPRVPRRRAGRSGRDPRRDAGRPGPAGERLRRCPGVGDHLVAPRRRAPQPQRLGAARAPGNRARRGTERHLPPVAPGDARRRAGDAGGAARRRPHQRRSPLPHPPRTRPGTSHAHPLTTRSPAPFGAE
ncbi:MAG: cation:proton antiporter [Pseudonocardiaceae bacterium]